jgi:hypothetical protein
MHTTFCKGFIFFWLVRGSPVVLSVSDFVNAFSEGIFWSDHIDMYRFEGILSSGTPLSYQIDTARVAKL